MISCSGAFNLILSYLPQGRMPNCARQNTQTTGATNPCKTQSRPCIPRPVQLEAQRLPVKIDSRQIETKQVGLIEMIHLVGNLNVTLSLDPQMR